MADKISIQDQVDAMIEGEGISDGLSSKELSKDQLSKIAGGMHSITAGAGGGDMSDQIDRNRPDGYKKATWKKAF